MQIRQSRLTVAILMIVGATAIRAQDFADAKTAMVDYSKASVEPHKGCEELG